LIGLLHLAGCNPILQDDPFLFNKAVRAIEG